MQFDKIFSMPKMSKGQGLPLRLDIFLFSHISILPSTRILVIIIEVQILNQSWPFAILHFLARLSK